jgi:CRISPR-associated exonuclease Cas4
LTYAEDELLPLSGVQHLVFCERQAALIHVEKQWADNAPTIHGAHRHHGVHETAPRRERRGDLLIVRGLYIRSFRLGLAGIADVVEFHNTCSMESGGNCYGTKLPGIEGKWIPFPIEYKRGRPKSHRADEVQLCVQAICLEEMLDISIEAGALFYGKEQRRTGVNFDEDLRKLSVDTASRFHDLVDAGITPPAIKQKKCKTCSLLPLCMPEAISLSEDTQYWPLVDIQIRAIARGA